MLNSTVVKKLNTIVDRYKGVVPAPVSGNWKAKGDGELWASVLGQIAVVGSAASGEAVKHALSDRDGWYASLASMESKQRLREIHRLLRKAGVRYAAADIVKCKKVLQRATISQSSPRIRGQNDTSKK